MNEDLILKNEKLIYYFLKKYNLYDKRDDYYDIGAIALVKAAKTFNKDKGYTFSTYAGMCISNELLACLRMENMEKRKANQNTISLDEIIYKDGQGKEISVKDTLESGIDIEQEIIRNEERELLYNALSKLDPNDLLIISHLYGLYGCDILTQFELAEILNTSQTQISRAKTRIINEIKKMLGSDKE